MKYRKVHHKYKLEEDETFYLGVVGYLIETPWIGLDATGKLTAKKGYAFNGADCYPDTQAMLSPSCGHDAGLQLIGLGLLPKEHKKAVDDLLERRYYENLKATGNWFTRRLAKVISKTVWIAVRRKGNPKGMVPNEVLEAP